MGLEDRLRERITPEGYDLFAVFSRFECALKRGGFRQTSAADASWHKFADALPDGFYDDMRTADEAKILFDAPPDHLVPDGTGVKWSGSPKATVDLTALFMAIKTVRNNLLHGDKAFTSERDQELIQAALFVLNRAFDTARADGKFADVVHVMQE